LDDRFVFTGLGRSPLLRDYGRAVEGQKLRFILKLKIIKFKKLIWNYNPPALLQRRTGSLSRGNITV